MAPLAPLWPLYGPFGPFMTPCGNTYAVPRPVLPTFSRTPLRTSSFRSRCAVRLDTPSRTWYSLFVIWPRCFAYSTACRWRSLMPCTLNNALLSESRHSVRMNCPARCVKVGSGYPAALQRAIMSSVPVPAFSM